MAGLTNDSNVVFGVDFEVKALENPLLKTRWVTEPNIFEFDFAFEFSHINHLGWFVFVNDSISDFFVIISVSVVYDFLSCIISLWKTLVFAFCFELILDETFNWVLFSRACIDFRWSPHDLEDFHRSLGSLLDIGAHGNGLSSSESTEDEDEHCNHLHVELSVLIIGVRGEQLGHCNVENGETSVVDGD